MRKKYAVLVLSLSLMISMTGAAWSQGAPKQVPSNVPSPQSAAQGKQIVGEVVKVDIKAKRVTVKTQAGEKQFGVANVTMTGYGSIADIKPGDKIAVLYEEKGGKLTAKVLVNHSAMMKMPRPETK
jgi:Cu/Ag efflux protein CusF